MKKSIVFLTSLCLFCCLILKNVSAAESDITEGSVTLDLNELEIGDSIIIYENPSTGGKLNLDILPVQSTRLESGTGSWSGGTIPSKTVRMYPHYEDKNYDYSDIGYYVTYDGKNKKILDTYGESVGCLNGEISEVRSRIVSANATATNYAKSQLSWLYENNGASLSYYLRQDINNKNQLRLSWRF